MTSVRDAVLAILGAEHAGDVLSLSAYALQVSKIEGRSATTAAAQGDSASVVVYGPTMLSTNSLSANATHCNVALTRAIDLFLFVAPREKYARALKEVEKPGGGTTPGFRRLIPTWMDLKEFCEALYDANCDGNPIELSINQKIDANLWRAANKTEREGRVAKRLFAHMDPNIPTERNIKRQRVHFEDAEF